METSVETIKTVGHVTDAVEDCPKQFISRPTSGKTPASVMEQENNALPLSGIQCSLMQSEMTEKIKKETTDKKNIEHLPQKQGGIASIQLLDKPTHAFGALFGNSSARKKLTSDKVGLIRQGKNVSKIEQIKSSVALPFYHFSGGVVPSDFHVVEHKEPSDLQVKDIEPPRLHAEEVIPQDTKSD